MLSLLDCFLSLRQILFARFEDFADLYRIHARRSSVRKCGAAVLEAEIETWAARQIDIDYGVIFSPGAPLQGIRGTMQGKDRRSSGGSEVHGATVSTDDKIHICKQRS